MRFWPTAAGIVASGAAHAATAPAGPGTGVGNALQLVLSLAVVLGLIFGLTYAMKRLRFGAARPGKNLAVIDELVLGPKERVLLLKVGDRQALVGLAASNFVSLEPLAQSIEVAAPDAGPNFADRLRGFMSGGGKQ